MLLTETPYIEFYTHPYLKPLLENWELIRDQFWASCENRGIRKDGEWIDNELNKKPNGMVKLTRSIMYRGKIKSISMMNRDDIIDNNERESMKWGPNEKIRWFKSDETNMPFMWDFANQQIHNIASVIFNIIWPGAVLNHHWGLNQNYLRIHLCLEEAEGCIFNIEGWERRWENGKLFAFDDANVFHGTKHTGNLPRTIMMIDMKKTVLKPFAKNWPCRDSRPDKEDWDIIRNECKIIKQG